MDLTRQYVAALRQLVGRPASPDEVSRRGRGSSGRLGRGGGSRKQTTPPPVVSSNQQQNDETETSNPPSAEARLEADRKFIESDPDSKPNDDIKTVDGINGVDDDAKTASGYSAGSESSSVDMSVIESKATKFIELASKGLLLQSLSSKGRRDVLIKITSSEFMWGSRDPSKKLLSVSLESLYGVIPGIPLSLRSMAIGDENSRALHVVMKESRTAATFLTESTHQRDALFNGITAVLRVIEEQMKDSRYSRY